MRIVTFTFMLRPPMSSSITRLETAADDNFHYKILQTAETWPPPFNNTKTFPKLRVITDLSE